jgi:hypothetical protein
MSRSCVVLSLSALLLISLIAPLNAAQRTVRASEGWVEAAAAGDTRAFAVVENGTMYDVYLVGAESDAAGAIELMQTTAGKIAATKEISIAAFDRLEMSPDEIFLKLTGLKRPLKPGESITIVLRTDTGERLSVAATVK